FSERKTAPATLGAHAPGARRRPRPPLRVADLADPDALRPRRRPWGDGLHADLAGRDAHRGAEPDAVDDRDRAALLRKHGRALPSPPVAVRLRGERVALRPLVADDLDAVHGARQEPAVARWWGAFDAGRIREELLETPGTTSFAIDVDGGFAGVVMCSEELDPDYRHAGIDIFLAEPYQDQGYGSEAIRVLARH